MGLHGPVTWIAFHFCTWMMLVTHRKHVYGPPRACYVDSFPFLYVDDGLPHSKHMYGPPRACYVDCFPFLYVDDVRTSQETHVWASTGLLRG
jgi:hypothetical protein